MVRNTIDVEECDWDETFGTNGPLRKPESECGAYHIRQLSQLWDSS